MVAATLFNLLAVDGTPVLTSDGTLLGGAALLLSVVISGASLLRTVRQDNRAGKKDEIDTVIENYRVLLSESKTREAKLEQLVARQDKTIQAQEAIITEQRTTIDNLKDRIARLEKYVIQLGGDLGGLHADE